MPTNTEPVTESVHNFTHYNSPDPNGASMTAAISGLFRLSHSLLPAGLSCRFARGLGKLVPHLDRGSAGSRYGKPPEHKRLITKQTPPSIPT